MSAEKEIQHLLLVTKIRHAYMKKNVCSTSNSRVVSHPRWELVLSTWYGRRQRVIEKIDIFTIVNVSIRQAVSGIPNSSIPSI